MNAAYLQAAEEFGLYSVDDMDDYELDATEPVEEDCPV